MIRRKMRLIAVAGLVFVLTFALAGGAVAAQPPEMVKVLIGFTDKPGPAEEAMVRGAGGKIKYTYTIIPVIAAAVPESAIAGLLRNPNVTHINPDGRVYAIGEILPWGVDKIDAEVVHATGNKGTGVKVAIIDTGIAKDHPDLVDNIKGGVNFVSQPWWADPESDAWDDDNGHGSHVAGTVAAVNNEEGVIGVAPEASLYGVKVLDKRGSGYWSDIIAGIDWSVTNGMQVINMSLGASSAPDDVKRACDKAYAAGIVIVAAAGNSGDTDPDDDVGYPAKYDSVIAVAATDDTDTRASWSSDGSAVELAAPGVSILSTWKGEGYKTISGTSMASPHVAGVAALVIASGIADSNGNGFINDEVRDRMNATADDLGASDRDNLYGYGLVDAAEAALPPAGNRAPVADAGPDQSVKTGSTVQLDGTGSYDPDDDTITYSWVFITNPSGTATLSGEDTATPTFEADADGTYEVELAVSDGEFSSSDRVVVTAAPNQAPVADAGPDQSVNTSSTVELDGTGSYDPDGDTITYSWAFISTPSGSIATLSSSTTATPTFGADVDGTYEVELTVSDGELSASDRVVITAATVTEATTVSVTSIDYATEGGKNKDKHLNITVALVDDMVSEVSGASVSIELFRDGSSVGSGTGTTGTDGTVTFSLKNAPSGTYTTTVTDVTADGLTWDGITPPNEFIKE